MKKGVETFFNRPVQIITNGIDTDYFKKSKGMNTVGLKHELGISPDSLVLLTVAALGKKKGNALCNKFARKVTGREY